MKSISFICIVLFTIIQISCTSQQSSNHDNKQKYLKVFLVRHAEKLNLGKDPELSVLGKNRALQLVNTLQNSNIEYIHSSDFTRTRETAAPFSKKMGLTTNIYNPRDLNKLALELKETGGTHLVVGHSNTTPTLVDILGGASGTKINEKEEFDRLYIVTIAGDGSVNTTLIRYGLPYIKNSPNEIIDITKDN